MFKMSNATVLQDLVMDGMGGYSPSSPSHKPENATIGGIYLALNNASPVSTKSPYIYNCTSFGNGATVQFLMDLFMQVVIVVCYSIHIPLFTVMD